MGGTSFSVGVLDINFYLCTHLSKIVNYIENRPIDNHIENRKSTIDNSQVGPVVQWIERQIPVLKVVGSTPAGVTKKNAA